MSNPLVGAWEMVNDARTGYLVFTESHYGNVNAYNDRKTFKGAQPTEAEALEAYQSLLPVPEHTFSQVHE